MNEETVLDIIRNYLKEKEFPKVCPNCGHQYNTLKEYIEQTSHEGDPISYDAEIGDWEPKRPVGTISMSNCICGSTLSLSSKKMSRITLIRLMLWVKIESMKKNCTISEILKDIRLKIDRLELNGVD